MGCVCLGGESWVGPELLLAYYYSAKIEGMCVEYLAFIKLSQD